jgi:RHS repeat-associated protein
LNVAASNGGTTNTTVNRYVPKANETPTYDDDGNQTGDGRWIYRWDAENRLVEMETTSTAITGGVPYAKVRWTYDPLGRRIQRESWQGANPVVVTKYVYDGWQCLAELDGSNAVTATYAWGLDLSGSRTGAGGVGGLLWVNHTQHGRHFYSYDGNGNVCGLTSATDGTRTGGYEYDPFGGIIRANEAHPVVGWNEWRFSTKPTAAAGEMISYETRHYSSRQGRWRSRDRLVASQVNGNLMAAVDNSPINQFDLLGYYGVEGHYYYIMAFFAMQGYEPGEASKLAFYSQLPDELLDAIAYDGGHKGYFFRRVLARNSSLQDIGDYIHSLGLRDLEEITARRECLCRLLQGDEGRPEPWQMGFLLHALGDAYAHTWVGRNDIYSHRGPVVSGSGAGFTVGYPSLIGHAADGNWPDIIGNRPGLYVNFLDYLQGCLPGGGLKTIQPTGLREHILGTSPLLSPVASQDRARSFASDVMAMKGGSLGGYRPEKQDAFWLKYANQLGDPLPFVLPSASEIKQFISRIRCSCDGR